MEREVVTILLRGNFRRPVLGWATRVPGLVITPGATTHQLVPGVYHVTHVGSGLAITNFQFQSPEIATIFVDRVADLADWEDKAEPGPVWTLLDADKQSIPALFAQKLWDIAVDVESEIINEPAIVVGKGLDGNSTRHAT